MTHNSRQSDVAAALAKISFQNPETARLSLGKVIARVPASLAAVFPALLAEVPDPDRALLLLERLVLEQDGATLRLLERHNVLAHYALTIFGFSRYLGETLLQNPDLLEAFTRPAALDRSHSREDFEEALARFRGRSEPENVSVLLARFKRREYVRILLRDTLKIAPLAETTAEISALSDVLIEDALREAANLVQRRFGTAQHADKGGRLLGTPFTVLSLGKLGGNELNYSSDIDLLYLYGGGQDAPGAELSNKEYFIRLAQEVTEILSCLSSEGPIFRIDLRLRPQGNEGELTVGLEEALRYYSDRAHDWELQALIKVRHSAGDPALARAFIRAVEPHVYRENVNFAAIKTGLVSREKMQARRKRPLGPGLEPPIDIKIDPGGIRDIEFLVQCLQRVYGGAEPWLRSGGTLFSLQKLHDKGHITGKEFDALTGAYDFLRHLEHHLQFRDGRRVHRLPASPADLRILARSMKRLSPNDDQIDDLLDLVQRRMRAVSEIYQRIIYQQQSRSEREKQQSDFHLQSVPEAFHDPSEQQILDRLSRDSAALSRIFLRPDLDTQARRNLSRFLSAAFTSSERYAAVVRHPEAVERALQVFATSDYLTDILVRYPEEIATLTPGEEMPVTKGSDYLFDGSFARLAAQDPVLEYLSTSSMSYGEKLSLLRKHYRHRILSTASYDLTHSAGIYNSLLLNTAIAEAVIAAALEIAGAPPGLSILALGRLGSSEFDLLSDADLLFVCEEGCDRAGLTRAVEQIMHTLAAYTRDGTVFPVDTRLRPHGADGELLVPIRQLEEYFSGEAQAWEALMYTKLRFLAGAPDLGMRAKGVTGALFRRYAREAAFAPAAREMRRKLERSEGAGPNLKNSPGGTYDIDFITGLLLIRNGARETGGNLRDRLWRCVDLGILEKNRAAALDHAAELFRTTEHVVRLVTGRTHKWLPSTHHALHLSERLIRQTLRWEFPGGVETELLQTLEQVRSIYETIMA